MSRRTTARMWRTSWKLSLLATIFGTECIARIVTAYLTRTEDNK